MSFSRTQHCAYGESRTRHSSITSLRPNKIISLFPVMGLKILRRVGTHIFFFFFWKKYIIICISEMHKIVYFFLRKHKKNSRFHQ